MMVASNQSYDCVYDEKIIQNNANEVVLKV